MEGYVGLFATAFLSATILPFSSEALLAGLAASDAYTSVGLLIAASVGNTLGSVVNWALGRFCLRWQDHRWFPISSSALTRASSWYQRFGLWSLLLSWVPIIGDPLTLAAGVFRTPFLIFLTLVAIAKTARYVAILGLVERLF